MAGYRTHVLGGAIAYILGIVAYLFIAPVQGIQLFEWFLCVFIGSLFPDIDIKSKGQRLVYSLILLLLLTLIVHKKILHAAYLSPIICIPLLVPHRRLCHELWFGCVVAFGCFLWAIYYAPVECMRYSIDLLFFLLGFVSHIILDGRVRLFR